MKLCNIQQNLYYLNMANGDSSSLQKFYIDINNGIEYNKDTGKVKSINFISNK